MSRVPRNARGDTLTDPEDAGQPGVIVVTRRVHHTHVRIEAIAFDGVLRPDGGALRPDPGRPGLGVDVRWADLEPYRVPGEGQPPARH